MPTHVIRCFFSFQDATRQIFLPLLVHDNKAISIISITGFSRRYQRHNYSNSHTADRSHILHSRRCTLDPVFVVLLNNAQRCNIVRPSITIINYVNVIARPALCRLTRRDWAPSTQFDFHLFRIASNFRGINYYRSPSLYLPTPRN